MYRSVFPNSIETPSRTFHVSQWKQRLSILPCSRDLNEILGITQISNVILFIIPESGVDEIGIETVRIIRAHGFPSMIVAFERSNVNTKKKLEKQFSYEFGTKSFKAISLNKINEVVRGVCQIGIEDEPISKFIARPFLLIEDQPKPFFVNETVKGIEVSGYLRGGSLNANQLLHIPGFGDYQMNSVLSTPDPYPMKTHHDPNSMETTAESNEILSRPE